MDSKLNGTVAIVTGASSGIGDATARRLAEHGASVAVVARRKDRLDALVKDIETAGGTALAVAADIADRAQADQTVQTVVDRFGRIDILVNNAGLMLLGPIVGADVDVGVDDRLHRLLDRSERVVATARCGCGGVDHAERGSRGRRRPRGHSVAARSDSWP